MSVVDAQLHTWCDDSEKTAAVISEVHALSLPPQTGSENEQILERRLSSFDDYCESNDGDEIFPMEEDYNNSTSNEIPVDNTLHYNGDTLFCILIYE